MKFALLSDALPPLWSGQALVIKRLLQAIHPQDYCLISRYKLGEVHNGAGDRLPARRYYLPWEPLLRGHALGLSRLHNHVIYTLASKMSARRVARILQRERCEAVVACTDNLLDLPTGYFASRLAGVPFYAYIFDDYAQKWLPRKERAFAQRIEPRVLKGAAGIIVPNEFMQNELRRRHGVESTVIHNPCDLSDYEQVEDVMAPPREDFMIVYTGAVYDAHYDAFRNLLAALEALPTPATKLHLYTSYEHGNLMEQGLRGPVVYHDHSEPQTMPRVQRAADVLFLPLAFNSPYPQVVKTSAPGKMGEYLAARRPVLVHAPADTFIAWYFRRYDCGLVVDQCEPAKLMEAINRLRGDANLRERLSQNAWARAQADFSIKAAQARFTKLLNVEVSPRRVALPPPPQRCAAN